MKIYLVVLVIPFLMVSCVQQDTHPGKVSSQLRAKTASPKVSQVAKKKKSGDNIRHVENIRKLAVHKKKRRRFIRKYQDAQQNRRRAFEQKRRLFHRNAQRFSIELKKQLQRMKRPAKQR